MQLAEAEPGTGELTVISGRKGRCGLILRAHLVKLARGLNRSPTPIGSTR